MFFETIEGKKTEWDEHEITKTFFAETSDKKYSIREFITNPHALRIKDNERKEALLKKIEYNPTQLSEKCLVVSTIHSMKGGETDYSFVDLEMRRKPQTESDIQEEGRVWFVAFTRARKGIFIITGKNYIYENFFRERW